MFLQGKDGLAGKVLNEILSTPPTKITVFGPHMSHEIKMVGMITPFYNIVQVRHVVDDMVKEFTKLFLDIARQCIPTKTITVRDYDKPWFNNEIRKEIRLRDRLRKNVSSSYTISSICSSLIVFRSGGIQLLPLLDLIIIFIIFQ
jgi:hypothetical protein